MVDKPLLRLRARFSSFVVLSRHPVRLSISFAVPFFAFPDLGRMAAPLLGWPALSAGMAAAGALGVLIVLPQLAASWLDCRWVRYDVYEDHLSFTENFFLRAPICVQFRKVTEVRVTANVLQRLRGFSDVQLTTQVRRQGVVGQKQYYVIPDLKKKEAQAVCRKITALVRAARGAS